MKEINFKVLMYMDKYVDANLLYTGIYWRTVPVIYSMNDTIETLIERTRDIKDINGNSLISKDYIANLEQCQLVSIVIMDPRDLLPSTKDCIEAKIMSDQAKIIKRDRPILGISCPICGCVFMVRTMDFDFIHEKEYEDNARQVKELMEYAMQGMNIAFYNKTSAFKFEYCEHVKTRERGKQSNN